MDPITRQGISVAGSAGSSDPLYVDDVFSTFLYDGTTNTHQIVNGIDLAGEGGMVWIQTRDSSSAYPVIYDTEGGTGPNGGRIFVGFAGTSGRGTQNDGLQSFNSNGVTLGTNIYENGNGSIAGGSEYVLWSFRKAPGFFDVVEFTGTGSVQNISHSLGSVPGMIVVKKTSGTGSWNAYHRSLGANGVIYLNGFHANSVDNGVWNNTAPTSSVFTVGADAGVNANGATYIAYVFAHDDQSFGTDSNEAIIKCGSWTASGGAATVNLGFEPQFVITKCSSSTGGWLVFDNMRGMYTEDNDAYLRVDTEDAEDEGSNFIEPTATGFDIKNLGSTQDFIYIAIRRPHKPPTAATEVFMPKYFTSQTRSTGWTSTSGFVSDAFFTKASNYTWNWQAGNRLMQKSLRPNNTDAQIYNFYAFDTMDGVKMGGTTYDSTARNYRDYHFRRAPGFFDVVGYGGSGSGQTINHNLEAVPELIIVKVRDSSDDWPVYNKVDGATDYMNLNSSNQASSNSTRWNNTSPTSTVFTVGSDSSVNNSIRHFVAYLFASLDGISKVGSYTGTGYDVNVDCGFTNGARFVMIKRTDSTGNWYVWDTARGIVSGNDSYLLMSTNDTEVTNTDYIDPLNAGFTVTSSAPAALNANGGTFLFLAIA